LTGDAPQLLLVTGATGLVGSHVVEQAKKRGIRTRALVRLNSDVRLLQKWDVEIVTGGMLEPYSIQAAMNGATHVVHCAAKLGDWGRIEPYRDVNVSGLQHLLEAAGRSETLKRLVHVSSMAVYEARDHFGTDETERVKPDGVDAYAVTKVEAEQMLLEYVAREKIPGVILRPGWIYGPRDRTVIPRILERLQDGRFAYLGTGEQLINNTYVGNLVDAIFLALEADGAIGEAFNIRDGRLVDRHEFFGTIA
jgi:nucleoside-diphosphate-sugar epimerase